MSNKTVLAIETSCDETAAAVVRAPREILSNVVVSQAALHERFGGVVPEIASRSHQEVLGPIVERALEEAETALAEVDAIAVTQGPGLPGALMVGFAFAKGLSFASGKALLGVNHLEAHLYANFLEHPSLQPPFIALVVSGGHTMLAYVKDWGNYEVLGQTLDDAAGEAFDKVANLLGLGYPGGPKIAELALEGDHTAISFPRAMIHTPDYNFSLSGLKTAVLNYVRKMERSKTAINKADVCAAFQAAVVDVQVAKTLRAAVTHGVKRVVLAGGVAANRSLRTRLREALGAVGIGLVFPSLQMCTDNAAMVAAAALSKLAAGSLLDIDSQPVSNMKL